MPRDEHLIKAKHYAEQAEETLSGVTDAGAKAQTFALLAIAHAVMEAGFDIDNIREAIESNG
ncbi:hypothetical protein [Streptomyces sp. NPDC057580]|uniref:hypothetical protein n=1 Tax=Streptomyces sp. NPDC057580 TaxID=3346173 RepID=UPI0036CB128D